MRVEDLMTRQVRWCRPEGSLEQVARLMWDHDCGCIPVCLGDGASRVVGVITDRDICMSALFQGKSLSELRVSDAMSKSVETCRSADTLAQAEKTMRSGRIRRLPVLDKDGALVGMISLADLAREAAHERTRPHKEITETEVGDTLATICQAPPRSLPSSGRSAAA
jgi:CBS domain-containing protein